jgi:hypothetical protein
MNEFDELLDDNANWPEDPPRDTCPKCDGDGGWYEDSEGNWHIGAAEYGSDEVWVLCELCGGEGMCGGEDLR